MSTASAGYHESRLRAPQPVGRMFSRDLFVLAAGGYATAAWTSPRRFPARAGKRLCQALRSGWISFSISSSDMAPAYFWPLMKKVGVESTLNLSEARFLTHSMPSSIF